MSSQNKDKKRNWINLADPDGGKLQAGKLRNGQLVLVITGVPINSSRFTRAVSELGFGHSKKGRTLVKALTEGEPLPLGPIKAIWENARIESMLVTDFERDIQGELDKKKQREEKALRKEDDDAREKEEKERAAEVQRNINTVIDGATLIGKNESDQFVYVHPDQAGRFYIEVNNASGEMTLVAEASDTKSDGGAFLRVGQDNAFIDACAKGLIQLAKHSNDLRGLTVASFIQNVFNGTPSSEDEIAFTTALEAQIAEELTEGYETSATSWEAAVRLENALSARQSTTTDAPYIPLPLAIQAQRFLEKANAIQVVGNASPTLYSALPSELNVNLNAHSYALSTSIETRPHAQPFQQGAVSQNALFTIDANTPIQDILHEEALVDVDENGLIVILTTRPAAEMVDAVAALDQAQMVQFIEAPTELTGADKPHYLCLIKRGDNEGFQLRKGTRAVKIATWESLRSVADETLTRMGREDLSVFDGEDSRAENSFQRPYLAFSQTSPATTMTPKNIQVALKQALSNIEDNFGPIDDFVSEELELGHETLSERFSAEQVDAIALTISAMLNKRGFILGDETGVGKGRTIAATATWANKNDKKIIFVTERANLFSDLARDLIDINEWERFKPLITNADGVITNIMSGDSKELASPPTPSQMQRIMEGKLASDHNIVFTTYSQMNIEDSAKSQWLLKESKDAVLILDEAHVGAGSSSNMARHLEAMIDQSDSVIYSSATWAKSHDNLMIYKKALPESVSMTQVQSMMKEEGESFSEVFSTMLAMDGAFIRREHDLSKLTFVLSEDDVYYERNVDVTTKVSHILGLMAMLSGETNNMIQRINADTRRTLLDAQSARVAVLAQLKESLSEKEEELLHLHLHQDSQIRRSGETHAALLEAIRYEPLPPSLQIEDIEAIINAPNETDTVEKAKEILSAVPSQVDRSEAPSLYELARSIISTAENTEKVIKVEQEVSALKKGIKDANSAARGSLFSSSFGTGSAIHTVMRRTIAALSVDHTADEAIHAVQNGLSPLIVLDETGASYAKQLIDDEVERTQQFLDDLRKRNQSGELSEEEKLSETIANMLDERTRAVDVIQEVRIPTLQDMLRDELRRLGGIDVKEVALTADQYDVATETSSKASISTFIKQHFDGSEQENTVNRYAEAIEAIEDEIKKLPKIIISPIDGLMHKIRKAGFSVGEITGREHELVIESSPESDDEDTIGLIKKRQKRKRDVTSTVYAFNNGDTDVVIANRAGSTGLSFHSSRRFANQKQRMLIEMESDPNPNTRMQFLGRVNRLDQVSHPIIKMITLGLATEARTIMRQNKKAANQSSNVRSSRENAIIDQRIPDLLNPTGDRMCQEFLLENGGIATRLGIDMSHIERPYGLASLLTQRLLALLPPDMQSRLLEQLTESYHDAQTEDSITFSSRDIPFMDWRAKKIEEKYAWGPPTQSQGSSVFDAPVTQRLVTFEEDKNPLRWEEVREKAIKNAQTLLKDERVTTYLPAFTGARIIDRKSDEELLDETTLNQAHRDAQFARHLGTIIFGNFPKRTISDIAGKIFPVSFPLLGFNTQRNGFIRVPSAEEIAEGTLADLWIANEKKEDGTEVVDAYQVNLNRLEAINNRIHDDRTLPYMSVRTFPADLLADMSELIVPAVNNENAEADSWVRKQMVTILSSNDSEMKIPDLTAPIDQAVKLFEAKEIIALSGVEGASTIEEALALPFHNAVKEAHLRKLFVDNIMRNITIGSVFIVDGNRSTNRRFSRFFEGKQFTVANVTLPEKGHEGSLVKWKFGICAPGDEKLITISGALLKKIAGDTPSDYAMKIIRNVFDFRNQNLDRAQTDAYAMFARGKVTRAVTLLTGNAYQASEWAKASNQGQSIIYSDDKGGLHRAVQVHSGALHRGQLQIPKRLYDRESTHNLISSFFEDRPLSPTRPNAPDMYKYSFARNLESAINNNKSLLAHPELQHQRNGLHDAIIFIATGDGEASSHAIDVRLSASERYNLRNRLIDTMKAHETQWDSSTGKPYLATAPSFHKIESIRGSKSDSSRTLRIWVPAGRDDASQLARKQIIDAVVDAHGAELYSIPAVSFSSQLLNEELQRHYQRIQEPDVKKHEAIVERFRQRKARKALLNEAFDVSTPSESVSPTSDTLAITPPQDHGSVSEDERKKAHEILEEDGFMSERATQNDLFSTLIRPSA